MKYRIAIVTTHPIQYQVPWFRKLAAEPGLDLTVYYSQIPTPQQQGEGFGVSFKWDIPLLDGYHYQVLKNVATTPSVTKFSGCDTPELADIIGRKKFDAVIVNGWVAKSCLQALAGCRKHGIPCIARGESNVMRRRAWWKKLIHRNLLRKYDAFLTIGQSNSQFYRSCGVPEERLFLGGYCVDNDRFSAEADRRRARRAQIRETLGVPGDAPVFLFCGKFIPKKHPLTLLQAAAGAQEIGADFQLLMVGDGELRADCLNFAQEQQLRATFLGFLNQSELPDAYSAADCLVLPSDDGETWGLVVNEAMASGLAAIVSDRVGCHPDLIVPGRTGEVFPLNDCSALAKILARLSSDPAQLRRMGASAREHVGGYSYAALVAATKAAVEYVCHSKSPQNNRSAQLA